MTYDVAIVGCGPVGAVLANLLGLAGHRVAVVEAEREIFPKPRAIILDHEALRLLQHCRLLDEVLPLTAIHPGTNYLGAGGEVIRRYNPLPPPWPLGLPPTVSFVQPEVDAIVRRAIGRFENVETLIPFRLTALEAGETGAHLTITPSEGGQARVIAARYVVGADGANSTVRRLMGLPLEDLAFDEEWAVIDTRLTREVALPEVMIQYCRPSRPATFVIGPGNVRRWELKLMPGETAADFATDDQIRTHLAGFVPPDAIEVWRAAVYRFHAVVAERWRKGPVLLAGDAAHQMPPFLGQGLCCGLRDAGNLAWKLDAVLSGRAGERLIDTYEAERKPHIRDLTVTAKTFGLVIGELDADRARIRDETMRAELVSGRSEEIRQRFIPNLTTGLIDTATEISRRVAGTLFVQPRVVTGDVGEARLLDDVCAPGWLIVSESAAEPPLSRAAREAWRGIGGTSTGIARSRVAAAGEPPGILLDASGLLGGWLDAHACRWAVVRPDRCVFGAAADAAALDALVLRLAGMIA